LTDVRRTEATTKLSAGDQLQLERRGNQLVVSDLTGQEIGRIEPKLEQDLIRLIDRGNQYAVFVTAVNDQVVHAIIRETHRSATTTKKRPRPSRPTSKWASKRHPSKPWPPRRTLRNRRNRWSVRCYWQRPCSSARRTRRRTTRRSSTAIRRPASSR